MLQQLSIYQSIYFGLLHLVDVCTWELMVGSAANLSRGVCFSSWNKGMGVQLHLPHYSSHI